MLVSALILVSLTVIKPVHADSAETVQQKGINYQSVWHWYNSDYTTDDILHRDFSRFKNDGINYISLTLFWYRLEGDTRGDYGGTDEYGTTYGEPFLDDVKRVIAVADQYGLKVMLSIHTLWGPDSTWCTPDYVIDPVTGLNEASAVVRSQEMRDAFIDMFFHTVDYLKGTQNIWCWALNEPWYWPNVLEPPFENIDQKENFITLFQEMNGIVESLDGRPFTVRFPSVHSEPEYVTDIFADNWGWDERIFMTLDFITFTTYLPDNPSLLEDWKFITSNNVAGSVQKGSNVWIAEFGSDGDDNKQAEDYRTMLGHLKTLPVEGIFPWTWRSDVAGMEWDAPGMGYNICADAEAGLGRPAYQVFINELMTNQPPVLDPIGDKSVKEGQPLQFTISATDPNDDSLTYSASNLPLGASFDPQTHAFSWTPDTAGTYPNIHIEVSDGELTDSEDITITVNGVNESYDVNNDGAVNVLDIISVSQQWGATGSNGWISEDINVDGVVNVLDVVLISQNWTL